MVMLSVGAWGRTPQNSAPSEAEATAVQGEADGERLHRFHSSRVVMGTKATITLYAQNGVEADRAFNASFDLLAKLEQAMSDYRPSSELNRLSDHAGRGPMRISPMLHGVLAQSLQIAEWTDGRFDPTLGRLTQVWRRTRDSKILPEPEAVRAAQSDRRWRGLELSEGSEDADEPTAELIEPGVRLDLGGIGKGYAAQQVVALLKARGTPRCLVAVGGDVAAGDAPPDRETGGDESQSSWLVNIQDGVGDDADDRPRAVALVNAAMSTSGDLEQFVEIRDERSGETKRYAHILDPETGLGLMHRVSATVIASESSGGGGVADALATALCVAGPDHAATLLSRFPGVEARVRQLTDEGDLEEFESRGFEGLFFTGQTPILAVEHPHVDGDPPHAHAPESIAWWRRARFGMFIHWGLYAIPAGVWNGREFTGAGEWLMEQAMIKPADYEPLAAQFNPRGFDANEWARLAKDAGMQYVVITTKHHDGFCLFDSAHTRYDVMDATPFRRDIMRELSNAVRGQGLTMGWYHSIMDWHHPDANAAHWARYAPVMRAQVRELLTNYGPIGVMWFDGEWVPEWTTEQGWALDRLCRELQPGVLVNNRVGKGRNGMQGLNVAGEHPGDFGTPEQEVPAAGLPGVDWESCMTMNDTWGFKTADTNWKSSTRLIHTLIETASKGGNFLLNVGPDAQGRIPEASVERLREMGAWLRVNGASIYGSSASPLAGINDWSGPPLPPCTLGEDGRTLYVHLLSRPTGDRVELPTASTKAMGAYRLGDPNRTPLGISVNPAGDIVLDLRSMPPDAWDRHATVIAVEFADRPEFSQK
jgi:alpha-L-fucosidase